MNEDNKKTSFPASDTPPHPENQTQVEEVVTDKGSAGEGRDKEKTGQETSQQQAPPDPQETLRQPQEEPVKGKKGFPVKMIVFAVGFLLILSALVFFGIRLQREGVGGLFGQKGEIVWWGVQEEVSVVEPLIREFEEDNPGVEITYKKQSPQDYRVRLTNALASGSGPDIFEIHNSWKPMFSPQLSVAPKSVFSREEFINTFYPVIVSDLTTKEGVVAVPLEYDAITLYVNEDIFASAARTPPETWNEVRSLAIELTQHSEEGVVLQSGVALGFAENIDHWQEIVGLMLYQNEANPARPGECVTTAAGEETCLAADALSFYQFFAKNRVWDRRLADSTTAFASGKVAMYLGPTRRAYEINQANPNLKFRTVKLPQLPKDSPLEPDVSYATYWAQGVWDKSASKDAAWKFLKFLSTSESLEKLNFERKEQKAFAVPPPRKDMSTAYRNDPVLGSVLSLAPSAKSWFLADGTHDGETGINSQVAGLYRQVVGPEVDIEKALEQIAPEMQKVLSGFGVSPDKATP